jgi:transporter family protein
MAMTDNWFFWAAMSAIFAALTAIFAKIGLQHIDSDMATWVRTVIIIGVLSLFIWFTGKWINPLALTGKTWLFLGLSGVATGVSWVCYFRALQIGEASQVAPVDKMSVVLVAIFAVIFLGERPAIKDWFGIGLVSLGVLVLALRR